MSEGLVLLNCEFSFQSKQSSASLGIFMLLAIMCVTLKLNLFFIINDIKIIYASKVK